MTETSIGITISRFAPIRVYQLMKCLMDEFQVDFAIFGWKEVSIMIPKL